jgi:small-conductance mechanosensitive channel
MPIRKTQLPGKGPWEFLLNIVGKVLLSVIAIYAASWILASRWPVIGFALLLVSLIIAHLELLRLGRWLDKKASERFTRPGR